MDSEEYLAIVVSSIKDNFRSVCGNITAVKRISGLALTHIAAASRASPKKVLIRESSFHDFVNLKSIFLDNDVVASDIYICPLGVMGDGLIIQVDIDQWGPIAELPNDARFIRSHGLPLRNYSAINNGLYEELPACEVIPDCQKLVVAPLEFSNKTDQFRRRNVENSLRQILEGYEVNDAFKRSLMNALEEKFDRDVVLALLQMLGSIPLDGGRKKIIKYLSDNDREIRLAAFIALLKDGHVKSKNILLRCLLSEGDVGTRTIMLLNAIRVQILSKDKLHALASVLELSRREVKMLRRMK
ncbi:HEAT repeat domain-containing protein [Microbulbifer sp. OS29]|uniref:HEAT repeat domain-containing protein n=1 Tax=Microbulbifer okhotskensis TaxID=2926617 RepID=A0A9X2J8H2_9GAMM|nr:HEAT repeat domain-containing protein [Microbulbifer okhotskensis]MCO1336855.1 HEAT repeat domain-containing protein [Microbulbifer okhotskensis]